MSNNPSVNPSNFDINKISFSNPEICQIPNSKVCFKKIRFSYEYPDNDLRDLVIRSPPSLKCWGMKEDRDRSTDKLRGYTLVINLSSKSSISDEEQSFIDCLESICNQSKNHLVENRSSIERYDLEKGDLKKLSPIYYPMEKGEKIPGKIPKLYAKCNYDRKNSKITTDFIDLKKMKQISASLTIDRENPYCLLERIGFSCDVQIAIKVEAIFIGSVISLQLKLTEVAFKIPQIDLRSTLYPNISLDWRNKNNSLENNSMEEEETIETDSYSGINEEFIEEEEITYEEDEEEDSVYEDENVVEEIPIEVVKPAPVITSKTTKKKGKKISA